MLDPDVIAERKADDNADSVDTVDDQTVAMARPETPAPAVAMPKIEPLEVPANTPLAPPTAEPTMNSTPVNGTADTTGAMQPPVSH